MPDDLSSTATVNGRLGRKPAFASSWVCTLLGLDRDLLAQCPENEQRRFCIKAVNMVLAAIFVGLGIGLLVFQAAPVGSVLGILAAVGAGCVAALLSSANDRLFVSGDPVRRGYAQLRQLREMTTGPAGLWALWLPTVTRVLLSLPVAILGATAWSLVLFGDEVVGHLVKANESVNRPALQRAASQVDGQIAELLRRAQIDDQRHRQLADQQLNVGGERPPVVDAGLMDRIARLRGQEVSLGATVTISEDAVARERLTGEGPRFRQALAEVQRARIGLERVRAEIDDVQNAVRRQEERAGDEDRRREQRETRLGEQRQRQMDEAAASRDASRSAHSALLQQREMLIQRHLASDPNYQPPRFGLLQRTEALFSVTSASGAFILLILLKLVLMNFELLSVVAKITEVPSIYALEMVNRLEDHKARLAETIRFSRRQRAFDDAVMSGVHQRAGSATNGEGQAG
jgi:hypothetical protein